MSDFIQLGLCGVTRKCSYATAVEEVTLVGCVRLLERLATTDMLHETPAASSCSYTLAQELINEGLQSSISAKQPIAFPQRCALDLIRGTNLADNY